MSVLSFISVGAYCQIPLFMVLVLYAWFVSDDEGLPITVDNVLAFMDHIMFIPLICQKLIMARFQ